MSRADDDRLVGYNAIYVLALPGTRWRYPPALRRMRAMARLMGSGNDFEVSSRYAAGVWHIKLRVETAYATRWHIRSFFRNCGLQPAADSPEWLHPLPGEVPPPRAEAPGPPEPRAINVREDK